MFPSLDTKSARTTGLYETRTNVSEFDPFVV